jgi:Uma2 family endonuclease
LPESAHVRVQNPLSLDRHSLPFPDLVVLRSRPDFYEESLPTAKDVLFAIEVSHTTISYDRNIKGSLYAEAGIPGYWQLDVNSAVLVVRSDPKDGEYRTTRSLERGQTVTPVLLPELTFSIDELLGLNESHN